jgi:hypothetical protein
MPIQVERKEAPGFDNSHDFMFRHPGDGGGPQEVGPYPYDLGDRVFNMGVGAGVGALAGAILGGVVAGPPGATFGAHAGAMVGVKVGWDTRGDGVDSLSGYE